VAFCVETTNVDALDRSEKSGSERGPLTGTTSTASKLPNKAILPISFLPSLLRSRLRRGPNRQEYARHLDGADSFRER